MSAELERQRPAEIELRGGYAAAISVLADWAESAQAAHAIAVSLVRTSFVPEAFRGKPDEATAAILAGVEVGLSPMAALRSFDLINGTAAPRAITLRAIVQAQGHELWVESSSDTKAVVAGRRRGSDEIQRSTWTIERARGLNLASKSNWKSQPAAMLVARATAECARLIAADAILGLAYVVEELDDPTPTSSNGTKVRRSTRTSANVDEQPRPELPDEPTPARPAAARVNRRSGKSVEDAETVELPAMNDDTIVDAQVVHNVDKPVDQQHDGMTDAQRGKLHATFNELGMRERDVRLQFASDVTGRPIESSNELSKAEASAVIDALVRAVEMETENSAEFDEHEQPPLPGES